MEQSIELEIGAEKETEIKKLNGASFYICCFFIYCFIGWIYEVTWEAAIGNGFVNRGFLYGCYLPIYGFGTLILYFILNKLMKKKIKIGKINITPVIIFISIFFIVSTIEFIASWGMEILFHKRWWDYSTDILNLNGRVCVRNSAILTSGAIVFLYGVEPLLKKFFSKFKTQILKYTAITITTIMMVDLFSVIIGYYL